MQLQSEKLHCINSINTHCWLFFPFMPPYVPSIHILWPPGSEICPCISMLCSPYPHSVSLFPICPLYVPYVLLWPPVSCCVIYVNTHAPLSLPIWPSYASMSTLWPHISLPMSLNIHHILIISPVYLSYSPMSSIWLPDYVLLSPHASTMLPCPP